MTTRSSEKRRRMRPPRGARWLGALLLLMALLSACRAVKELQNVQLAPLTTAAIQGRVLDQQTGAPLTTYSVHLLDAIGERVQKQTANVFVDAQRTVRFRNVLPGSYRLRIELPGYEPRLTEPFLPERGEIYAAELRLARRTQPERSTSQHRQRNTTAPALSASVGADS